MEDAPLHFDTAGMRVCAVWNQVITCSNAISTHDCFSHTTEMATREGSLHQG